MTPNDIPLVLDGGLNTFAPPNDPPLVLSPAAAEPSAGAKSPDVMQTNELSPPLTIEPRGPVRPAPDRPRPAQGVAAGRPAGHHSTSSAAGRVALAAGAALAATAAGSAVAGVALAAAAWIHPWLGYAVWGATGVGLAATGVWAAGQLRDYRRAVAAAALKARLEAARTGGVGQVEDRSLRSAFVVLADRLAEQRIAPADAVAGAKAVVESHHTPGTWVDVAAGRLLARADRRARRLIERYALSVGLGTAMSPSGLLDTLIVGWRQAALIRQVAAEYGCRPSWLATARLWRRVARTATTVGATQEGLDLLVAAYGPQVARRVSERAGRAFDTLGATGRAVAPAAPITGSIVVAVAGAGKAASRYLGEVAVPVSGPFLQGVLAALLTVRVGMAAQAECRMLSLTAGQRRSVAIILISAIRAVLTRSGLPAGEATGASDAGPPG